MGTPDFAVDSLQTLHEAGCNIVGVITAPDKPAGRGLVMQQSAVKQFATAHGLHVLQPEKLKDPAFLETLAFLKADLQVVVAFRMLPEVVWNMPPMGTINLHGSLLPQYRGAAPINWAIINGESCTGVTTFKLKHEIDTGDILLQDKLKIEDDDNAGTVHDKLKVIGAKLLLKTIQGLATDSLEKVKQDSLLDESKDMLKHAPKIFTDTCVINWKQNGSSIINLIRGLSPFPGAHTILHNKRLKVFSARFIPASALNDVETGVPASDGKSFMRIGCNDGFIDITELQLEGKRKMKTEEFLRGYKWS